MRKDLNNIKLNQKSTFLYDSFLNVCVRVSCFNKNSRSCILEFSRESESVEHKHTGVCTHEEIYYRN